MANLIGTAGHVDHGKTTLIRALTGIDADRLPEEKRRGLTIEIGFAHLDLPGVGRVSIVDVPGHEKFIANMLVGALGMDVVLLCVAADESVMPQTVEHFQIVELLPVAKMVVALTRSDLVDEDTLAIAEEEVRELLAPSRFSGSPIVPVSATLGTGLEELRSHLTEALQGPAREHDGAWYMPVDRAFTVKGHGVVVTGTIAQGAVREGDSAVLVPGGQEVRVRSVQCHDEPVPTSEKGKRTALNLGGAKTDVVLRGMVVGAPGALFESANLEGRVRWLKAPRHGARVRVSIGADEAIAKAFLNDHDPTLVQLRFERPVGVAKGQPFIVRQYSPPVLLGGGRVTVPQSKPRRKSEQVSTIESRDEPESVVLAVAQRPDGLDNAELCRILGKSPQALGDTMERLKASGALIGFAGLWMTQETFAAASQRFLEALGKLHEREPTKLFQPRDAAVSAANLSWSGKPLDRFVSRLVEDGRLRAQGTLVALAEFKVKFSDKQQALLDRVIAELSSHGLSVPSLRDVTASLKIPPQAVEEIVRVAIAAGLVVRLEDGVFVPTQVIEETVRRVRTEFKGRRFSASEFREAMGTTRKYAIPLLEHLDAKGITMRQGDVRIVND
ncbi:MAG: selenocysteine-specific translation elongation factor [Fimbriimonadaceae bacterium]